MLKDLLKVTAVFAAGAAVGAAVAVLLTPKTGEEMREQLKDLAEDAKARFKKRFEDFLGRPMRTPEQCIKDFKNHTATEFSRISHSGDKSSGTW